MVSNLMRERERERKRERGGRGGRESKDGEGNNGGGMIVSSRLEVIFRGWLGDKQYPPHACARLEGEKEAEAGRG